MSWHLFLLAMSWHLTSNQRKDLPLAWGMPAPITGDINSALRITIVHLPAPVLNGDSSQWFSGVKFRTGSAVPVARKIFRSGGGPEEIRPPFRCHRALSRLYVLKVMIGSPFATDMLHAVAAVSLLTFFSAG